jgi:cobalt-zinc-cadmium efflux system outer membrane protein
MRFYFIKCNIVLLLFSNVIFAQPNIALYKPDTLSIGLQEAENQFLKNNLRLLSHKYSLDSAKAVVISARVYDNPQFNLATGFYEPNTKKFFDFSNDNREIAIQVSQLVKTAGKRNKAIKVAQTGVQITEYEFYDLLRTLRYTLRNDFFNIYYLEQSSKVYTQEIESLQKTSNVFEEQVKKGNIAQKEFLRIQSQLYTLQAELINLQNTIDDANSEFKLLIRAKASVYIKPTLTITDDQKNAVASVAFQTLLDSASQNRYDLKIAKTVVAQNEQYLRLQKAMAIPDLTFSGGYDRLGSYVNNFNSLGIGLDIPIFNRNQGNIKQARAIVESSKLELTGTEDELESQVENSYAGALRAEKLLNSIDVKFDPDFNKLIREVTINYEKRNISLLEFIDFYDSYKQNVLQLNNLKYNRISQLEQLNYTTGTNFFNK